MTRSFRIIEGNHLGTALKVAIVVSRFNQVVTDNLLDGATGTLVSHGVDDTDITVVPVPGAFEIPLVSKTLAKSGDYDAVIALGCVIRGETPHFDYVCGEAAKGVSQVSMETGVPVIFGVLTTETTEQAMARAGLKAGNKGSDAALSAIETANLLRALTHSHVVQTSASLV